jgi:hypothetical protein
MHTLKPATTYEANFKGGGLGQPYGELPTVETIPVQI